MPKPILVTGSHRSGSTWVGNIISSASKVFYVQEPFNLSIKRKNSPCIHWFEHVQGKTETEQKVFKEYLKSFYSPYSLHLTKEIFKVRTTKKIIDFIKNYKTRSLNRALIKDPIAVMSAEWMYENIGCDVVVVIRHPAAFVASIKIKDWQFDFNNFLNQKALMDTYLKNFKSEIEGFSENKRNVVEQGILLWNSIYSTVNYYQENYHQKWIFVKHEDLSITPISEFKNIFDALGLQMDESVINRIKKTSNSNSTTGFMRNSKENIETWKQRLTKEEVDLIKSETKHVWQRFYKEEDWH